MVIHNHMADLPKIGIDIGTSTVKVVELAPAGQNKWKLLAAATTPAPVGGIMGGAGNLTTISQSLVKLIKEAGIRSRRAVAALPEEQVSSHVVEMPMMSDGEVKQALQWQVEQYIPIPADKAVWSHQVIKKDQASGGMEVLLVAAAKNLVNSYIAVLEQAGLEVTALETELTAAARSEVPPEYPLSVVVDIGAKGTDMGVVSHGQLVFARTIPTAGEAFTRAIETVLSLDPATAEQYKRTYGFSTGKLDGKIAEAMKPVVSVIGSEIRKTVDFYVSKHPGETVGSVILSGGVASLPDITGMLSGIVGIEMAVGNPFARVSLDAAQTKTMAGNAAFYGVAVGLAMRPI